jgi:hypothetical protein
MPKDSSFGICQQHDLSEKLHVEKSSKECHLGRKVKQEHCRPTTLYSI